LLNKYVTSVTLSGYASFTQIECPPDFSGYDCRTHENLYSSGEVLSTGITISQNRLIPGLLPLPESGIVKQIVASPGNNHVLILMNNSTVYTFGRNEVNLNSLN
jgi:hypothetical protein